MHESQPYGLFVHGAELTEDDISFIDHCCKRVSNFKQLSNLESIKYIRELPNGGFVIIQDVGGTFRAIAYKPESIAESKTGTGEVQFTMPMLFSGVINKGVVTGGRGVEIKLTSMCTRRVGGYNQTISSTQELKRFRCPYSEENKVMLVPNYAQGLNPEDTMFTQYHGLKATWFSGSIAEAVQIVSGFGRQKLDELPDDPVERAVFSIPTKYMDRIKAEIGENVRLPGYMGKPDEEGKIPFSFTFYKTDAISFDNQNNPWLVRVQPSGVWAMPFPLIPISITEAFREYITEVGDTELEMIIDRFGGVPSGEGFPDNDIDFYRWVRAGTIIKVCDVADFYSHSAYSTVCGWSSNLRGTNLINTCYDYENKYCYGYTYQINLNLSPAQDRGWIKGKAFNDDPPNNPQQVARYISELFSELGDEGHKSASIRYQINRSGADDIEYWDNYKCDPIASHEGRISCSNTGYLYGGARLKLPEPFLEGCISMDFSPQELKSNYPKIDTIVFAYYIGDDLKVIKNFNDERKVIRKIDGNFDDEMVIGTWEQTEYLGSTGLQGSYYSTDFDDRQEISPFEINTKLIGRDVGYGTPYANYGAYFSATGIISRKRYYSHKTNIERKYEKTIDMFFMVPFYMRNACIYGYQEKSEKTKYEESHYMLSADDPNRYEMWTYDWTWHWAGAAPTKMTGVPFPKDSYPIWAEVHMYDNNGSAIADFADSGDWLGVLPMEVSNIVNPPNGITLLSYGGNPPPFQSYKDEWEVIGQKSYRMEVSALDRTKVANKQTQDSAYYSVSPDRWGNVVREDGCRVMFGTKNYVNISIKTDSGRRYTDGHTYLADNSGDNTFIGVINE